MQIIFKFFGKNLQIIRLILHSLRIAILFIYPKPCHLKRSMEIYKGYKTDELKLKSLTDMEVFPIKMVFCLDFIVGGLDV